MNLSYLSYAGSVLGKVTVTVLFAWLFKKCTLGVNFEGEFALLFVEVGDHADDGDWGFFPGDAVSEDSREELLDIVRFELHVGFWSKDR